MAGCSDYGFHSPPIEVPGAVGQIWDPISPHPSLTQGAECEGVPLAAAGPASSDTCDTVDFDGWDLAIEWEVPASPYALPMVIPAAGEVPAVVYTNALHSEDGGTRGIVELDGSGGSERASFRMEVTDNGETTTFARGKGGGLAATWHRPSDWSLAWWSESEPERRSEPDQFGSFGRWLDVDGDGVPEIVSHNLVVGADGATMTFTQGRSSTDCAMAAHGDFTGNGRMQIASTFGIWDALTGDLTPWNGLDEVSLQAAPVMVDGELALLGVDGSGAFRARPNGEVVWRLPRGQVETDGIAVGDVDGDGVPEMAVNTWEELFLVDVSGQKRWSLPSAYPERGSVVMADLDGDGAYEVIAVGNSGLRILDGATGTVLAFDTSLIDDWEYDSPAIADVDLDGSAEIVVGGRRRDTGEWVIRSYGAAQGRWARTRPVWNELDYDVTTIQDDGRLAVWPIPNWESYNNFRAQPAHDGPHPDLTVTATDLCCDSDTVFLAVQASNLGSVGALPGATITLSTNDGTGWHTVATHLIDDGMDPQTAAAGFAFEVPRSDWGNLQVLQVTGTDGDECDFVNDRVQVDITCPE